MPQGEEAVSASQGKPTFPESKEKFKLARSKLIKAIKFSKRQSWTKLLGIVDEDPWGRPYKVVIGSAHESVKTITYMSRTTREDRQHSVSGARTLQLSSEARN